MTDLVHPYSPATLWFDDNGSEFKDITRREIKAHFEQHHKRFVRYSRLIRRLQPSNKREERLVAKLELDDLWGYYPDYILKNEDGLYLVHIAFTNPFHRTQSKDSLHMPVRYIRGYIAYHDQISKILHTHHTTSLLLTNSYISLAYLGMLRHNYVVPVAINNSFLRTVLRTIRRKQSFKERYTQDSIYIKPSTV